MAAFWNKPAETMGRTQLRALQLQRLRRTVRLARRLPLYAEQLRARGLSERHLQHHRDVTRLPFTTREDLQAAYPFGLLTVPYERVMRLHTSSGTTGKPKAVFFTRRDLAAAAENMARSLVMGGVTAGDVIQNMMTYGLFTGALMLHYGAEKIGAMVIPAGPGNTARQVMLMQDFGSTVLHLTPSYALYLADFLARERIDRSTLRLRAVFVGAEPYTEETRGKIERLLGVQVCNCYGLTEMNGPGVAGECPRRDGLHVWEDSFWPEIIDPATGEVLPDGEKGELVLTTLHREAMPILRYRTRDITCLYREKCRCGRTHRRIARILGRADDMLILRGVNFYPQQVERVLMRIPGLGQNYQLHLDALDQLTLKVEIAQQSFDGNLEHLVALEKTIVDRVRAELTVKPKVELLEPGTLPVSEGKTRRVFDNRTL